MIPIDQEASDETGREAFRACVASLLELNLAHVPLFPAQTEEGWHAAVLSFLETGGFYAIDFAWRDDWNPFGLYILSGTVDGAYHSVVAKGRIVVHDPAPARRFVRSRAGLDEPHLAVALVPLDPARPPLSFLERVHASAALLAGLAEPPVPAKPDPLLQLARTTAFVGVWLDPMFLPKLDGSEGEPWMVTVETATEITSRPRRTYFRGRTPDLAAEKALKWLDMSPDERLRATPAAIEVKP